MTKILPCLCGHHTQDLLYGKGKRVHNETKSGKARCTVCGSLKG